MDEQRAWWESLFQIHEYATYADSAQAITNAEVDFLEAVLMLDADQSILDLACGNGRHILELARRGYRAEGIELAPAVVEHVQAQIDAEDSTARIIQQDMRHLDAPGAYDVILVMNSSLGFWSDADHQQMLQSIATALSPGGRLVLQCINPYQIATYMRTFQRGWHRVGPGYVLRDSTFNPHLGRLETSYRYIEPDGGEAEHPGEHIRLYTYPEWSAMLQRAGLQPLAVFGDAVLPVVPFDFSSQWQVLIARKPHSASDASS